MSDYRNPAGFGSPLNPWTPADFTDHGNGLVSVVVRGTGETATVEKIALTALHDAGRTQRWHRHGAGPVTYPGGIGRAIPVAHLLAGAQATQRVAYVDANPLNLRLANLAVETDSVTSTPSPAPYPPHVLAPGSAPNPPRPWFNNDPTLPAGA